MTHFYHCWNQALTKGARIIHSTAKKVIIWTISKDDITTYRSTCEHLLRPSMHATRVNSQQTDEWQRGLGCMFAFCCLDMDATAHKNKYKRSGYWSQPYRTQTYSKTPLHNSPSHQPCCIVWTIMCCCTRLRCCIHMCVCTHTWYMLRTQAVRSSLQILYDSNVHVHM